MAGPEGDRPHFDRTPQQLKPHLEAGNGAPGIPPNLNERAKPPPERPAQGGSESIGVQELQPGSEVTPTQPKRKRGRPKLSEFTEEERGQRWVERHERLYLREWRREQRQMEATLSESERRNLKEGRKAVMEGIRAVARRMSEDKDSVKFRVRRPEKGKKRKTKHDIV